MMISSRDTPNTRPVLLLGDAIARLKEMPAGSVQTCVTSPPYWGLRDYGADGQFGLEDTPEEYVANLVAVFREVRRVLRDDGTLWLNLGDSYAGSGKGVWDRTDIQKEVYVPKPGGAEASMPKVPPGLKPKDLVGIPWRVAIALQADGWYLRSDIVWQKVVCMPEPVKDRPTRSHEYIFLLAKNGRYYYDADAVKEKGAIDAGTSGGTGTRNARSVWTFNIQPYPEAHFATFPEALPERCIKAGTSERGCCPGCGAPYSRVTEKVKENPLTTDKHQNDQSRLIIKTSRMGRQSLGTGGGDIYPQGAVYPAIKKLVGWEASCECDAGDPVPCVVLDPFAGSGTTCAVAARLGRASIGIELNPEYLELAQKRCWHGSRSLYDFDPNIYINPPPMKKMR